MAFKKMEKPPFPRRHWALSGYPGSGKSSFAAQLNGPKVVIDADHRFSEVLELNAGAVYELGETADDNLQPLRIATLLEHNMPGSDVKTIVVDSLTAIISPHVVQAMMERDEGRSNNLMAAFKKKALAMRMLQDTITRWGTDVLWIYHLQEARDAKANTVVRASVSQTELARLTRSINLQLQIVQEDNRRGIRVVWARRGRSGMTLWDEVGHWQGMPGRIEEAVYGGLTLEEQLQIEQRTPRVFPNSETAIAWGMEQGAFTSIEEARRTYEHLKRESQPGNAHEMGAIWVAEVEARLDDTPFTDGEPSQPPAASAAASEPAAAAPAAAAPEAAPAKPAKPAKPKDAQPRAASAK
jgi:predicted kinase